MLIVGRQRGEFFYIYAQHKAIMVASDHRKARRRPQFIGAGGDLDEYNHWLTVRDRGRDRSRSPDRSELV